MSLTTRQRTSIFQKLIPVLGEEDADAMMAEFPAVEHDVLVTREHLRAEIAVLRGELRAEMQGLATKAELREAVHDLATKAEMSELRAEVRGLATKAEMSELRTEVHAHINRAMAASTTVVLAAMGLLVAVT